VAILSHVESMFAGVPVAAVGGLNLATHAARQTSGVAGIFQKLQRIGAHIPVRKLVGIRLHAVAFATRTRIAVPTLSKSGSGIDDCCYKTSFEILFVVLSTCSFPHETCPHRNRSGSVFRSGSVHAVIGVVAF